MIVKIIYGVKVKNIMTKKLELKCPLCEDKMAYIGKTGKLLHYICINQECLYDIYVYEKEKSNNPKVANNEIVKGEIPEYKERID